MVVLMFIVFLFYEEFDCIVGVLCEWYFFEGVCWDCMVVIVYDMC